MRRLILLVAGIAVAILAIFGIAVALGLPVERDPRAYLEVGAPASTALACGLLVADFVLPVPSSPLLAFLGAAHGIVLGAALGVASHAAGAAIAFGLGRMGRERVARWVGPEEHARVDAMLARWSILGIAATRPVPILAETTAFVAGTTHTITWRRYLTAVLVGETPYAAICAAAGSEARDGSFGLAVVVAVVIAAALWWAGRAWSKKSPTG